MSMRYIIRRKNPEDLSEVKKAAPTFDKQLGDAGENFRRFIEVPLTASQYVVFHCQTKKKGIDWIWICPSIELVAETEKEFYQLTDRYKVPRTTLTHLPAAGN